ncbi:MAG TPA: TIR domain-containing protein [Casimicrobiaceae bacterium]|nr:TIR domain-containing protein [Casimicrobiaceae bacterium]
MSASPQAVFLSYASQDVDAARRICDALRAAGLEVWLDQSELRGGDAWDASIRKKIKECALFVPLISANTQARMEGYFRREWNLAVSRTLDMADDQAFLLPVVIDATVDVNARVPEKFREVQWTRLPAGEASAAFAERVHRLLSGGVAPSLPIAPPRAMAAATPAVAAPSHEPPSIAVLPFVNMSRDEENEYFADGLAEELLNVLAKIRGLRVAARSSAFTFKGKGATVAEVGRALNVATVLEGSVRKAGNRMRIAVQLVKVVDGYQLWSETYDRTLEDIFAVQDDIAQSVLKELRTALLGGAADAMASKEAAAAVAAAVKGRSTDPEAHRLFLQARYFIDRNTREDTKKGIGYLKEALALEPEFALAWAELGRAHASEANWGWASAVEGFARSREAITRALALEPDLAEGHAGMGWIQMSHDFDMRGAEVSYRRALELAPGNALVLHQFGFLLGNLGRFDEGIGLGRRAVGQDPLSASAYFFLGLTYWTAVRPAEAVLAMRKALELAPQSVAAHTWLSIVLLEQGRNDEALVEALQEPEEWGRLFALAVIQHAAGRQAESDRALHELAEKWGDLGAYQVAQAHGARGEVAAAFEWLERAFTQRDPGIFWTKVDPLLRSLHADPRWGVFLRKLRLAD